MLVIFYVYGVGGELYFVRIMLFGFELWEVYLLVFVGFVFVSFLIS